MANNRAEVLLDLLKRIPTKYVDVGSIPSSTEGVSGIQVTVRADNAPEIIYASYTAPIPGSLNLSVWLEIKVDGLVIVTEHDTKQALLAKDNIIPSVCYKAVGDRIKHLYTKAVSSLTELAE